MTPQPKSDNIYQIKVTLKRIRPPIWRRLQVAGHTSLAQLHHIIQAAMGWIGYHLYTFNIDGEDYGIADDDWDVLPDTRILLDELPEGYKFTYVYDMGDWWEHEVKIEKILPPEESVSYPRCIKGKRACPPEDCGGPWGYAAMLEALADPEHPEHDDYLEWLGEEFDPEDFDLEEVNRRLTR